MCTVMCVPLYMWVAVYIVGCHTWVVCMNTHMFPVIVYGFNRVFLSLSFGLWIAWKFFVYDMTLWFWGLYVTQFACSSSLWDFVFDFLSFVKCWQSSCLVCSVECLCLRSGDQFLEWFILWTISCGLNLLLFFSRSSELFNFHSSSKSWLVPIFVLLVEVGHFGSFCLISLLICLD